MDVKRSCMSTAGGKRSLAATWLHLMGAERLYWLGMVERFKGTPQAAMSTIAGAKKLNPNIGLGKALDRSLE